MAATEAPLPRFIVFGEALTDLVRTGEQSWTSVAGGSCWNVARVAATLGVATAWAGAVSTDCFGQDIVDQSRAARLDLRFLQQVAKPPLIAVVHQSHPPRYFFLGNDSADLAFDETQLPAGWQEAVEVAHFGCISLIRPPLGERLLRIAAELKDRGVRISYDANYRNLMGPDFPRVFEHMARLADVIKVSDEDLGQIYPGRPPAEALAGVRSLSPHAQILFTRGAEGIEFSSPSQNFRQPVFPVAVVDTVGAGDACMGGFIARALQDADGDIRERVRFAAATAAAACTRSGAHAPSAAEIQDLLARPQAA